MTTHLRRLTLCAALWPGAALPPAVADPMRPLLPPGAAATSGATVAPAGAAISNPDNAAPAVRRLLAIRQDSNGERSALFGDRWLRAGDRYTAPQGPTLVLAVGSNHIELEQDKVKTTLHLLAPLLPPQWPALPAAKTAAPASATAAATAAATATAAPAPRTERPSSP